TFEASNMLAHYASVLDTLAYLKLLRGNLDEADDLTRRSMETIRSAKNTLWVEISTQITMGRCLMARGRYEEARDVFEQGVEICLRSGTLRFIADVRLLLADSLLALGEIDKATALIEVVRERLSESTSMLGSGLLMRVNAKREAARGHIA